MPINLNNFVDIKINRHISSTRKASRDTAVLILCGVTIAGECLLTKADYNKADKNPNYNTFQQYFDSFFENGGIKLRVIGVASETKEAIKLALDTLDLEEIVVGSNASESVMREVAKEMVENGHKGIYQKILVSSILKEDVEDLKNPIDIQFYVLKAIKTNTQKGKEMAIAAYLTQINREKYDTVADYAFTKEYCDTNKSNIITDDAIVNAAIKNNINIDTWLLNDARNLGGNDTAGYAITSQFMLILLHQTLTFRLIELLETKITYSNSGLILISSTISAELQEYVKCGYLSTNKAWTDDDLVYENYTIIKKNTGLPLGYKFVILPFSSLTAEQRAAHQLPDIYILIADNYMIRKINITGEIY